MLVFSIHRIVSIKHFSRRLARDFHNNRFGHAGLAHVRIECVAEIVRDETQLAWTTHWIVYVAKRQEVMVVVDVRRLVFGLAQAYSRVFVRIDVNVCP